MEILQASESILKNYGIFGFVVVVVVLGAVWFIYRYTDRTTGYFIDQSKSFQKWMMARDNQISKITEDFSRTLGGLTEAINREADIQDRISEAYSQLVSQVSNLNVQGREQKDEILKSNREILEQVMILKRAVVP